jgi:signal transduction histidine kinase
VTVDAQPAATVDAQPASTVGPAPVARRTGSSDAADERPLALAITAATAITGLAAIVLAGDPALRLASVLPVLVAAAGVCAALLARHAAPSLAWLATIGASLAAGSVPIDVAQGLDPDLIGVAPWALAAARSSIAAIVTLAIATAYAIDPGRRIAPVARPLALGLLAWLVVACAVTLVAVAAGERRDPAFTWVDVATAPIGWFVRFVAIVVVLGVLGDVRAAADRSATRTGRAGGGAGEASGSRPAQLVALATATLRELWPGQAAFDETTRTAERTRLAGDLHAVVLPSLRRAIAEAEAGGDPDALARHLRTVDLELERLMADRWPVVLETFGLVAALEDLAERIETDGALKVQIDVEQAGARPPVAIERAAWRVAQVAIDNVARHAAATTVAIAIGVDDDRVSLEIADDGRGFDPATSGALRPAGRGLADATRRAADVGATIRIGPRPGGGTTVAFSWRAGRRD